MTDELKQWEYDRGYIKGQADILEKIKEEIESNMVSLDGLYSYQKSFHNNCNNVRKECIEIIDKHLKELEVI